MKRVLRCVVLFLMLTHLLFASSIAAAQFFYLWLITTYVCTAFLMSGSVGRFPDHIYPNFSDTPQRFRMQVWLLRVPLHILEGVGTALSLESTHLASPGMSRVIGLGVFLLPIGLEAVAWGTVGGMKGIFFRHEHLI